MKHLFTPYELAVMAKEKEFNEPCLAYYNKDGEIYSLNNPFSDFSTVINTKNSALFTAPLYQQIVDWFRETHNINPTSKICSDSRYLSDVSKNDSNDSYIQGVKTEYHETYYEALNQAIKEAFKII